MPMNSPVTTLDSVAGSARVECPRNKAGKAKTKPPLCLRFRLLSIFLAYLVWCLATTVQGAETNSLRTAPVPAMRHPRPNSQEVAAAHERAGRKPEAAALYEEIVRTNAAARKVLSYRLVMIYSETGETNRALAWAREVMHDNPDPPAYLAAVHARLGQWKEAREILEHEIVGNTNTVRAVTLRWQLGELHAQAGDCAKASKVLVEATDLARGTAMKEASRRRLKALKGATR